jgi:lon-related putative ATP-dependent protease
MVVKLTPEDCRKVCPDYEFDCESTAGLSPLQEIIGQQRAVRALQFGLRIKDKGFNIFVSGRPGTGRKSAVNSYIGQLAKDMAVPDDWAYVNNFHDPQSPGALRLPAGMGIVLKKEMEKFLASVVDALRAAFESRDYVQRRTSALQDKDQARKDFVANMTKQAADQGFVITQSPIGLILEPVIDGRQMPEEELAQMPTPVRKEVERRRAPLQAALQESLLKLRDMDRDAEETVFKLNRQVATFVLEPRLLELRAKFKDHPPVIEFLAHVQEDILDHLPDFVRGEQPQQGPFGLPIAPENPKKNYTINLIVDNSELKGAPVEIERNPTYFRLFGSTEKEARFGALFTDFTMIRAGSAHKANGGFIVLPVELLFQDPLTWPSLKQTLAVKQLEIEEPAARMGYMVTKTLHPEPIPFDAKVILVGDAYSYELLYSLDKDFRELFKVKADFDISMDRTPENIQLYAQFVCMLCTKEKLRHVDSSGLAAVIDHGSRVVEDKSKLSTMFAELGNVIREANFYAGEEKSELIERKHINRALEEKVYRSNMIQERLQEMVRKGVLLIETGGEKVGQVNGLSVLGLGDYAFGMPSKITASVGVGKEGVVNVEREAQMSGPSHTKGIVILSGYLNDTFASEKPLSLSAKLTFEQSYSGVDGDSASSTELYAILSALSGKPIDQSIAVTGSVNQKGEVQAIGGVNEKIEGYFDVCKLGGLTGKQGVMIPESNVQNLMLREDVVEAVKKKKFNVWSVSTIDEGIEHLTGVKAGKRNAEGSFPKNSINGLVQARLAEMADTVKEFR